MPTNEETPRPDNQLAGENQHAPSEAPHPGSKEMPRWTVGELSPAPVFSWRQLPMFLGPGLVMGAAAVGGGEWLTGPMVTGNYGGALLWLATLSILAQTNYNIEISRYTLYCGEPIFNGKFRTLPGPRFWLFMYLLLDFGSFLPYLAKFAAVPLFGMIYERIPDTADPGDAGRLRLYQNLIFIVMLLPLIVGGKVYRSLKVLMSIKLVVVMGFLLFLAFFYSSWDTWREIGSGFFKVGSLPVKVPEGQVPQTANIFVQWWNGQSMPAIDLSMIGIIAAMAAIAGNGGLTNTPISNFTRDQGWGMGKEVGAIPSIIGRQTIELSHEGKVFIPTTESLPRWKGWLRHIQRDQMLIWMPACFIGMALPSMLSVEFLQRGTIPDDRWLAAGMTAEGVAKAVGPTYGDLAFRLTLFCGFLVLVTSAVMTADGVLRRWLDAMWTASPRFRKWDTKDIGLAYFGGLCLYAVIGLVMLNFVPADNLLTVSTTIYNVALGFSCWHVIVVNSVLLPKPMQPSNWRKAGLIAGGIFFMFIAGLTTVHELFLKS